MTSAPSTEGPGAATPATGISRRTLARRIAVCAAVAGAIVLSGAAGWWLQAALHPSSAVPLENAAEDAGATHDGDHADRSTHEVAESTAPHPPADQPPTSAARAHGDSADQSLTESTQLAPFNDAGGIVVPPTPEELTRAQELGEQYLLDGAPGDALREFDWILEYEERSHDGRLHYYCGICAESQSDFNRALTEYGVALAAAQEETLAILCRLGQARVWRALGHVEMGSQLLASAWLTSSESRLNPSIRPFTAYAFAEMLLAENLAADPPQLAADNTVLFPEWECDLFDRTLLKSVRDEDPRHTPVATGIRVLSPDASDATNVLLQVRLPRMGILNIVDSLGRATELRTVWSGSARQATAGRSAEICLARSSLGLCLDALTAPLGVVWELRDGELRLSLAKEVSEGALVVHRRQAARRALEHAVNVYPEFILGPQALVSLGNMALQDGQLDVAGQRYQEMLDKYPRSPICADAWFNLAKLKLLQDYPDAALENFWHVVDTNAPPVTAATAYLYIGRLLLDAEQPRRAVTPLTRATQWSTDSTVRTKAVLGLAAAHLLQNQPELANEVLMDFRSDVRAEATLAAFLSAFARFRAARTPTLKFEEGQSLLAAAEPLQNADFFGRYGWYLRGRAYEELLLPEMAIAIYREALEQDESPPYRYAIRFGLGSCLADIGELDAARLQLTGLMETADEEWQRTAAFRLCRLQLDSREPLAAARIARNLLTRCTAPEDKARALQLLGAAYQRLGDHASAALCFAGTVPGTSTSGSEEH